MAPAEEKCVQLRVRKRQIVDGRCAGNVFWATPAVAKHLYGIGAVDIIGLPQPGPSETKPAEASEKKSFDTRPSGPTTDSVSSLQSGSEAGLSVSVAAPVSPESNASESSATTREETATQSPSTPPIELPPGQTSATSRTRNGGTGTKSPRSSRRSED